MKLPRTQIVVLHEPGDTFGCADGGVSNTTKRQDAPRVHTTAPAPLRLIRPQRRPASRLHALVPHGTSLNPLVRS